MNFWYCIRSVVAVTCAVLAAVPPVEARTKKGDKLLKQGQQAEAHKDYDAAQSYYEQALATDPNEAAYLLVDQRVRGRAAEAHLTSGRTLQSEGKLEEALAQFQKAFLADPSSAVSFQEVRQTTAMLKERAAGPPGTPVLTPLEKARQEMQQRINSLEGPPVLRPINNRLTRIQINNQPARLLYESVAKLAGINVLFDPSGIESVAGKNFNLDLNDVTLQEALNYIALETHSFWKPISRNAIFVTQESDPKRQEYQDEVVKVFYIQNASTTNEFQEIFNAVRTGAKLTTGVFSVPSQSAIIARGSMDTMDLVEKLVHDLDRPKAEVVVDVIVMAVNKSRSSTIGASILGVGGLSVPFTFTPRNPSNAPTNTGGSTTPPTTGSSTTGGTTLNNSTNTGGSSTTTNPPGTVTLQQLGHLSSADYSVALPSTLVQALLTDATTHILQRPQVRATDGGKASLLIGSSIPYVSGSLNSAVATAGSIPYSTTQFTQVNVGTQIEFEPHVNGPEDISMRIKVELSNVLQTVTIAGIQEPIIGKQTDEANIRMKDGEVSVLAGLSDREQSNTIAGFPGVSTLPLLSSIFGTRTKSNTDNEIMIAMIPHIIRAPDLSAMGNAGVFAGTERVLRVQHGPNAAAPFQTTPPAPENAPPGQPSPLSPVPAGNPPGSPVFPGAPTATNLQTTPPVQQNAPAGHTLPVSSAPGSTPGSTVTPGTLTTNNPQTTPPAQSGHPPQ